MKHREFMGLAIRAAGWIGEGPEDERESSSEEIQSLHAMWEKGEGLDNSCAGLAYFAALMAFILEARACMLAERYEALESADDDMDACHACLEVGANGNENGLPHTCVPYL